VNPTEWAHAQGVRATVAYLGIGKRPLPIAARNVGWLILVSPDMAATPVAAGRGGLSARCLPTTRGSAWTGRPPACQRGQRRPACPWSGGG